MALGHMTSADPTDGSPTFDLHSAIRRQSWTWVGPIVRRLHLTVEIVDDHGVLCPPLVTSASTTSLRRLLGASGAPELGAAARAAIRANQRTRASAEGVDVLIAPLVTGPFTVGALVLTDDLPPQASTSDARSEAERDAAATWLARAIGAQLDVPAAESLDAVSFDRVSSLHRLLHEAVEAGSERDVLVAFAEALIAWDDVAVRAYAEDIHGRFGLAVSTPGLDRTEATTLPIAVDRSMPAFMRLPVSEAARLGFRSDADVFTARIGDEHRQPWILVLSGVIGISDESRLTMYVELLKEAIVRVAMIAETRTTWAILQQLLATTPPVEEVGRLALSELTQAVDALGAALVVTASNGVHTLSVGDGAILATNGGARQFDEIVSTHRVLDAHTMVLAVRRAHDQPFTRREQRLVEGAAATFAAWLPGVLPRLAPGHERRSENRDFDQVLERVAQQTVAEGMDVVLLVVVAAGAISRPGMLHKWVADIRGLLRASDLAGALSDREIGVLLPGASTKDLAAVSGRILARVTPAAAGGGGSAVTIGVASAQSGSAIEESLVRLARADAVRGARGNTW
jgi:hypothetical protein